MWFDCQWHIHLLSVTSFKSIDTVLLTTFDKDPFYKKSTGVTRPLEQDGNLFKI